MTAHEAGRARASIWLLRTAFALLPIAWATDQAAGAIWALMCLAGALEFARTRHAPPLDASRQSALRWLCVGAGVSAALITLSVLVHHDELRFVRQELKPLLLFLAVAAWSQRRRLDATTARLMDAGLMLGIVVALGVPLLIEREHIPGNAIPWATTVAAAICVLMPRAVLITAPPAWRIAGILASAVGLIAIVLSQTRAALWVLPWLALLLVTMPRRPRTRLLLAAGLLAALVAWGLWAQPVAHGRLRLAEAMHEIERFRSHGDAETSIGARLALWQLGVKGIAESPASALLGHGSSARQAAIHDLAARAASPHLASLRHLHSQYLNSLYDFGLAGLAAIVSVLLGMTALLRCRGAESGVLRWQVGGLIWLQAIGFVTNANWLHGHYVFMVSLLVAMCVLPRDAGRAQDDGGQFAPALAPQPR